MNSVTLTFYVAAAIAVVSTVKAISQLNAVRALLYLIVSLLSVAVVFFILGAPFAAALEVITFAGAIMVLFVFVIMILNLGPLSEKQEKAWLNPGIWVGPALLALILLVELVFAIVFQKAGQSQMSPISIIGPEKVGAALLGPYILGVELASLLLLAGLVGAHHLGIRAVSAKTIVRESVRPARIKSGLRLVTPSLTSRREAEAP